MTILRGFFVLVFSLLNAAFPLDIPTPPDDWTDGTS